MSVEKFTDKNLSVGWNGGKTGPTCPADSISCGGVDYDIVGYGEETVAIVLAQCPSRCKSDLKANANLFSAAPDMYRALRDVAGEIPVVANNHRGYAITITQAEVDAIRAALAKADGEQS